MKVLKYVGAGALGSVLTVLALGVIATKLQNMKQPVIRHWTREDPAASADVRSSTV